MKAQPEENIVNVLAAQVNRLEAVLAEAKRVLQDRAAVHGRASMSPVICRRLRIMLPNGTPDNLNCITFAFRIDYSKGVLLAGWSIANNENVDLEVGRTLAIERLDTDPLEMPYFSTLSLVDNVFVYFYGVDADRMLINNEFYRAIMRKLRAHQSQKAARADNELEQAVDAFVDAIDNR